MCVFFPPFSSSFHFNIIFHNKIWKEKIESIINNAEVRAKQRSSENWEWTTDRGREQEWKQQIYTSSMSKWHVFSIIFFFSGRHTHTHTFSWLWVSLWLGSCCFYAHRQIVKKKERKKTTAIPSYYTVRSIQIRLRPVTINTRWKNVIAPSLSSLL